MDIKREHFFPQIHYFDTDFITMYEQTWARIENQWVASSPNKDIPSGYLEDESTSRIDITEVINSTFFILYSNPHFSATQALDFFYRKQDSNGVIHRYYDKTTGNLVKTDTPEENIAPPTLIWAEHNYYNRTDNKRRLKDILPKLNKYLDWLSETFQQSNGLFLTPQSISPMYNIPRKKACYLLDYNAQVALAYFFMIKLATFTNFRNLTIKYTKMYYQIKTLINKHFWNDKDEFYYDLDKKLKPIKIKTINTFWTLLANIPNNSQITKLVHHLTNPNHFYTDNTFPTISRSNSMFAEQGNSYLGSVYPFYTYMVIKGLVQHGYYEIAREAALKHVSNILAVFYSEDKDIRGVFWEAYQANNSLPAKSASKKISIRKNFFPSIAISTISMVIEHIIGFDVCLPKKMVSWAIPHLEFMGIESFQLKRNMISTIVQKTRRGWEIRHSSEKLYYFSVDILELKKQKTLPIPSGKCSLLLEKL